MATDPDHDLLETFDADFLQLEGALTDPIITDAFNEVAEFNELLKTEVTTAEDVATIIATLNHMWGPIIATEMTVSGNVTFLDPQGDPFTEYYDEARMISNGFIMESDFRDPGPQTGRKVELQFFMPIPEDKKDDYSSLTMGSHLVGTALVDDVRLTLDGISVDRARAWLSNYAPDLIERVDGIVLNTDGSAAEVMAALQGLDLNPELSGPDATFAIDCLGVYLNGIVDFDRKLPYLVDIKGKLIIKDLQGQPIWASLSGAAEYLIYIQDLLAIEITEKDFETGLPLSASVGLFLQSTIVNARQYGEDLQTRLPIDSINSFESVRELVSPKDV